MSSDQGEELYEESQPVLVLVTVGTLTLLVPTGVSASVVNVPVVVSLPVILFGPSAGPVVYQSKSQMSVFLTPPTKYSISAV